MRLAGEAKVLMSRSEFHSRGAEKAEAEGRAESAREIRNLAVCYREESERLMRLAAEIEGGQGR